MQEVSAVERGPEKAFDRKGPLRLAKDAKQAASDKKLETEN